MPKYDKASLEPGVTEIIFGLIIIPQNDRQKNFYPAKATHGLRPIRGALELSVAMRSEELGRWETIP